jgi:GNAT superfamily N-acetyltransferase
VDIEVTRAELDQVLPLKERYREEAGCQLVRDSLLWRGLAEPWLVRIAGHVAGYGALGTTYVAGRVIEFHLLPRFRRDIVRVASGFIGATGAEGIEAQTNLPGMVDLLYSFARDVQEEYILFDDGHGGGRPEGPLSLPGAVLRPRASDDSGPEGEWAVEWNGRVVGAGGLQTHYNPPFADVYMEVVPDARCLGVGGWMVQELARICREQGRMPAARCEPENRASRRALERGGLRPCGRLLAGQVAPELLRRP